jgi:UDP-N-acetyl-D-mannosaminuronate dehydrogenase
VAYSPIRGMPKNDMKQELQRWDKFVAGTTADATGAAAIFFRCIGLSVRQKKDPAALELGKLLSTTYHAVKIAAFQEFHRLAVDHDVQLGEALELIADDDGRCLDKPVMFPDVIGGTCLMPNVQLLLDSCSFRSGLLNFIQRSNDLRKEEIKASFISAEVKAIKDQAASNDVKRRFLASTKDELRANSPWDCNCRMCDAVASCGLAYTGGKWPCNQKEPHNKN